MFFPVGVGPDPVVGVEKDGVGELMGDGLGEVVNGGFVLSGLIGGWVEGVGEGDCIVSVLLGDAVAEADGSLGAVGEEGGAGCDVGGGVYEVDGDAAFCGGECLIEEQGGVVALSEGGDDFFEGAVGGDNLLAVFLPNAVEDAVDGCVFEGGGDGG